MRIEIFCCLGMLLFFGGCTQYSKVTKMPIARVADTAEQRVMLKVFPREPLARLGHYLDAANAARLKLAANPADRGAQSDYNFATSRIVEIIAEANLSPWKAPIVCDSEDGGEWSLRLTSFDGHPEYRPSDFEILPTDRYRFRGKLVGDRTVKSGLGAPVVAISQNINYAENDPFSQGDEGFYGLTAMIRFDGRECEIELKDPLEEETVKLGGASFPLAADFQASLAFALAEKRPEMEELAKFLDPAPYEYSARLTRLQPYNPEKIPVLLIHGLTDSPSTWMPLISYLRNDETIRDRYQFWVFSYPTGLPYFIPADTLRDQLDAMRAQYPDHKDIVVIGHSMGGMIGRELITDSGMALWDTAFEKPPGEMGFSDETRRVISKLLIFRARPEISRVIYASASHRGSEMATEFSGRLGAKVIGNPISGSQVSEEVLAAVRPELPVSKRGRLPNSVNVLDPDSPFLKAIDALPSKPGIPYHSIIGDGGKRGTADPEGSSDGIVSFWSSHLEGAESELIIPSKHWTILHPLGMAEISRILHRHLGSD